MKSYLSFKLPEQEQEFQCAIQGQKLSIVLWDLDNWLRNMHKYEEKENVRIYDVRKKLRELLQDNDITVVD